MRQEIGLGLGEELGDGWEARPDTLDGAPRLLAPSGCNQWHRAGAGHAAPMPEPGIPKRLIRRRFSAECKPRIVEEVNALTEPGPIGALLRREGLYSSHLGRADTRLGV